MTTRGRPRHPEPLTPRQQDVWRLLRQGLTDQEIADQLGVTTDGVKYHVKDILRRTGAKNRYEAALWTPVAERRWWTLVALPIRLLRRITFGHAGYVAGVGVMGAAVALVILLIWGMTRTSDDPQDVTVSGTSTPTTAPAPIVVEVIDDANGNGRADPGERPLAGWSVVQRCGDQGESLDPTGDDGRAPIDARWLEGALQGGGAQCNFMLLGTEGRGWIPTTSAMRLNVSKDQSRYTFLLQHVGDDVMVLSGALYANGLPATTLPTALPPFADCAHAQVSVNNDAEAQAQVFLLGARARAGCPQPGDAVAFVVDGLETLPVRYEFGSRLETTIVGGADAMRFYTSPNVTAAKVNGQDCGVVVPMTTWPGDPTVRVFVLAADARPGCGAPGIQVDLFHGDELITSMPWRAGDVAGPPVNSP